MKEVEKKVTTYKVHLMCDCGGEYVNDSNRAYLTAPLRYELRCNKCGKIEVSDKSYPYMVYKEE